MPEPVVIDVKDAPLNERRSIIDVSISRAHLYASRIFDDESRMTGSRDDR